MTTSHAEDDLLTPQKAAMYLDRSEAALAMMRYRGNGPKYFKAAGRIRYRQSAIDSWLAQNERDRT